MSLLRWGDEEWFNTFPQAHGQDCDYCGDAYEVRDCEGALVCASRKCREQHYREIDKEGGDEG